MELRQRELSQMWSFLTSSQKAGGTYMPFKKKYSQITSVKMVSREGGAPESKIDQDLW